MTTDNTHNLSVGHCNIQGGLISISKSTQIAQLLRKYELDVLSLNEINLGESVDSCTLNIPSSFDFIRKDRENSCRGGCALLVNKKMAYKVVECGPGIKNIEAIWIKIKSSNIYICGFYRSNNYCHIDTFIEYMNKCMKKLRGKRVMWIGDINVDQNDIKNSTYKKLDLALKTYGLKQTIQGITRFHKHGQKYSTTTIDVVFTNFYSDFEICQVLDERIGDHQAIRCTVNFSVQKPPKYEKIIIRNHSQANIKAFKDYLKYESAVVGNTLNCTDVEEAANALNSHLNDNYDHFFPHKTISVHEKYLFKPSKELLDAIKLKNKLFGKFKNCLEKLKKQKNSCERCNDCILCIKCNDAWKTFKTQRNLVTKLKKFNKRQNVITDLKAKSNCNDLKGIWKTIKMASNLKPTGNPQSSHDSTCELEADSLNEHFSIIGYKLQSEIPVHNNMGFADFLSPASDTHNLSEFIPVSSSDVANYVKSLSSSKAVFDQMPLKIFKAILPCILEPITHIVNLSLTTGIVPSFCKTAKITPIFKSGDTGDPSNYRPISILPIVSKCIEYFVSVQLKDYIETNNIFCNQQYGFRENHSTTYLMLDLIDKIYDSKSNGQVPAIIFLDIKKAFDTVNHDILLEKLNHYGISGTALLWFRNYLTGRYQCTKFGNKVSSLLLVLCGVPQGSLLGPILFSIYINDLQNACKLSIPFLFADDGALFFKDICRKSYMNMQIELLIIKKWLEVNKLSLNIEKTEYMVFDQNLESELILVDDILIYECKVTKYLGLMIDHKLSFAKHVEHIEKKVSKRINAMYKSKNLLPLKYRKMFANSLVLPVFDYLDVIYGRAGNVRLSHLDILYKKVAKIALDVPTTETSLNVYRDMKWLPLHLRRQLHLSNFMFRIIKGSCPPNAVNKFRYISGGSRNANNCNLYTPKSNSHKQFSYLGAICWNIVPHELRNIDSVKTFSNTLKAQFLSSISNDVNYSTNNNHDYMYKPILSTSIAQPQLGNR